MARIDDRPLFYTAAQTFVDRALRADDSLFTPGVAIWTAVNLQDLYDRFIGHPDESHDSFMAKFQRQLIPGQTTTFRITFPRPGFATSGACSFYCGLEHARMRFLIDIRSPADYQRWAAG